MDFSFDNSVSGQQKAWIQDAIALASFPWASFDVAVNFKVVPEPPCIGHQDYMCTQADTTFTSFTVNIREGADDPTQQFNKGLPNPAADIKAFFMECVVHELGHVVVYVKVDHAGQIPVVAPLFTTQKTGQGIRTGTEADWSTPPEWADHIQEAAAEVFKDTYLNEAFRVYDNRSNWDMSEPDHRQFITLLTQANRSFSDSRWGPALGQGFYPAPQVIYEGTPYPAHQDYRDNGTYPVDGSGQTMGAGGDPTIPVGGTGYPGPSYFNLADPWRPPTHPETFSGWVPRDPKDWNGTVTCTFESIINDHVRAMGGLSVPGAKEAADDKLLVELTFGGNTLQIYGRDYQPYADGWRYTAVLPNAREMMQFMRDNGFTVHFDLKVHYYADPGGWMWPDNSLPGGDNLPFSLTWTGENVSVGDVVYPYTDPSLDMNQGAHQVQRMGASTIR